MTTRFHSALGLFGLCVALQTAAAPDAGTLLAASDAVRNPDRSFSLTVTLSDYRHGTLHESSTLAIFARPDKAAGQYDTLIRFVAPARDSNKLMLKHGNTLWFYDPQSHATVPISPQQRLLGQAANGDVVTANLARDYTPVLDGEEDIRDGDRQLRHCYRLSLRATRPDVTYHHITLWVDSADYKSRKALFHSESGSLLKTAYYRGWRKVLGAERPTETVIIDGLDPAWITVMRNDDYAWRDIPQAWMQRDYLPRFKAE